MTTNAKIKAAIDSQFQELEIKNRRHRNFDVENEIHGKRDALSYALKKRLAQKNKVELVFTIRRNVA